jgi:hypothetical protein
MFAVLSLSEAAATAEAEAWEAEAEVAEAEEAVTEEGKGLCLVLRSQLLRLVLSLLQ